MKQRAASSFLTPLVLPQLDDQPWSRGDDRSHVGSAVDHVDREGLVRRAAVAVAHGQAGCLREGKEGRPGGWKRGRSSISLPRPPQYYEALRFPDSVSPRFVVLRLGIPRRASVFRSQP